ncbi:MAG: RND transporter [Gammaproteobacteria bacterium]|nr:RND transporter [Gammaproteobacteria bacterium]
MLKILDKIPLSTLLIIGVLLGLAPMTPEPHLVEKIRMLSQGALSRPIDIFDLVMHGSAPLLLIAKIIRMVQLQLQAKKVTEE